jgi:hypothetical protein
VLKKPLSCALHSAIFKAGEWLINQFNRIVQIATYKG